MKDKRLTWSELSDILSKDHSKAGVVVFKQNPNWVREFSEGERSYIVHGDEKFFYNNMISTSIWANAMEGTDKGVRLDWYMFYEDEAHRWKVDYCYLLENK